MIKIRIKNSNEVRILLGTGFGMYMAQGQKGWGSIPSTNKGKQGVVAVCDEYGSIEWIKSDNCEVIEIDGNKVSDCF